MAKGFSPGQSQAPPSLYAKCFCSRWRIEEAFNLIKARLPIENWSGFLPHTVEQDFYTTLIRANCTAVFARAVRPEEARIHAPEPDAKGWRHTLNRTLTMKSLRHFLPRLLTTACGVRGYAEKQLVYRWQQA
jgi:hypothetical protein